jgi:tRNA pseudouridine55 synthase
VLEESDGWAEVTADQLEAAVADLRGEIDQLPPAYSAKKVDGERAYERARQGKHVILEPCRVTIRELEITRLDLPEVGFRVTCSSGTYVRALARDIGDALGVGAHLTSLRRTRIGSWDVDRALEVDHLSSETRVSEHAVSPLDALDHLPIIEVDDEVAGRLGLGQAVPFDEEVASAVPLRIAHDGALMAIGEAVDGILRPRKVFAA